MYLMTQRYIEFNLFLNLLKNKTIVMLKVLSQLFLTQHLISIKWYDRVLKII